ncbi:hypothetical protein RBU49_13285 [Clostridium sp. MB40-C1]|uniref:hypothetical protein n=1 Tax=Clostridium sp. MB40-C1 TaxID=3070996 RepID=UPI0027E0B059|nr:hypothetical protein [Clostridium sp. MB40-C1]WMJ79834.1 hypothetical protein RBU49_13285 [Clostridium sp. MB40-C1]
MATKKSYSRYFIILQEDEKGFSADANKFPTGYTKIEKKNDKCKVSYYVQNLKQDKEPYYMVLICNSKDTKKLIKLGKMNLDNFGSTEVSYEYEVSNLAGSGIGMDAIKGACIVNFKDANMRVVLNGFINGVKLDNWKAYSIMEPKDKFRDSEMDKNIKQDVESNNDGSKEVKSKDSKIKESLKQEMQDEIDSDRNLAESNMFDEYERDIEKFKNINKEVKDIDNDAKKSNKDVEEINDSIDKSNEKVELNRELDLSNQIGSHNEKEDLSKQVDETNDNLYKQEEHRESQERNKKSKDECKKNKDKDDKYKDKDDKYKDKDDKCKDKDDKYKDKDDKYKDKDDKCKDKDDKYKDKDDKYKDKDDKCKDKDDKYKDKDDKCKDKDDKYKDKDDKCKDKDDKCKDKDDKYKDKDDKCKDEYPLGTTGEFFKNLAKNLEEIHGICPEMGKCKWYKVPVGQLETISPLADFRIYNMLYYPMSYYYPYIKKQGYYLVGYKCDSRGNMKYIVYAIPGTKMIYDQPFGGTTGFTTWTCKKYDDNKMYSKGYWVMFYDFKNCRIMVPVM